MDEESNPYTRRDYNSSTSDPNVIFIVAALHGCTLEFAEPQRFTGINLFKKNVVACGYETMHNLINPQHGGVEPNHIMDSLTMETIQHSYPQKADIEKQMQKYVVHHGKDEYDEIYGPATLTCNKYTCLIPKLYMPEIHYDPRSYDFKPFLVQYRGKRYNLLFEEDLRRILDESGPRKTGYDTVYDEYIDTKTKFKDGISTYTIANLINYLNITTVFMVDFACSNYCDDISGKIVPPRIAGEKVGYGKKKSKIFK